MSGWRLVVWEGSWVWKRKKKTKESSHSWLRCGRFGVWGKDRHLARLDMSYRYEMKDYISFELSKVTSFMGSDWPTSEIRRWWKNSLTPRRRSQSRLCPTPFHSSTLSSLESSENISLWCWTMQSCWDEKSWWKLMEVVCSCLVV